MIEFKSFWSEYPRKVGRWKAEKIWAKMPETERELALKVLRLWKDTHQWQSAGGIYIPHGSTFLAQKRYLDEPWIGAFDEAGITI
jgi:hypothetical protein